MEKKTAILGTALFIVLITISLRNSILEWSSSESATAIKVVDSAQESKIEEKSIGKPAKVVEALSKSQIQTASSTTEYGSWNEATMIDIQEIHRNNGLNTTRIRLVQPQDLPYLVRIEERIKIDPATGKSYEELVSETIANHVIVGLKLGIDQADLSPILHSLNARLAPLAGLSNQFSLHLSDISMDSAIEALEFIRTNAGDLIEYAELDHILHSTAAPNDRLYNNGNLWGLHNQGQSSGVQDADIDAPEAWNIRSDASNVIVAVIDTGIRYTHEDLSGNMWVNSREIPNNNRDDDGNGVIDDIHGYNGINNNGDPMDLDGHGTHCAGTIGAVGNNGIGSTGVAWKVQLMACRFLGAEGGSTLDGIECINYARQNGAHIMSNSWGGGGSSTSLFNAIGAAKDAGIVFVAAAGNDGQLLSSSNRQYPASYNQDNIVSVASHTRADTLSSFSNYGTTMVDIAAPGSDIASTYFRSDTDYKSLSGTSMATPHVSGIMALLKAEYPSDNYSDLIDKLYAGVVKTSALENKVATGGRANLEASLGISGNRPRITEPLADQFLIEGDTVSLGVNATSNLPITYSWKKDNSIIAGATSATLTIPNATTQNSGNYTAVVTNQDGSVQDSALITILQSHANLATAVDSPSSTFTSYGNSSWKVNTVNPKIGGSNVTSGAIGNEATSTLLTRVLGPGEISFWWRVSSEKDYDFLVFRVNNEVVDYISGESEWVQFSTTLANEEFYTLSWSYQKDQSVIDGQDAGFVDGVSFTAEGNSAPVITSQPKTKTITAGNDAIFEVVANGSTPLSYQWFKDTTALVGQTQSVLTISSVRVTDEGSYSVVVANSFGSVSSNQARLSVDSQPPTILTQPTGGVRGTGTQFSMAVTATGTSPFSYQWQKDNVDINGATQPVLEFSNIEESDAGTYRVNVSNAVLPSGVYSNEAILGVVDFTLLPTITKHPESKSVSIGFSTVFSVEATGEGPLSYLWVKDGQALSSRTQPSLTLATVDSGDAGTYSVKVINAFGAATSNPAVLTLFSDLGSSLDSSAYNWVSDDPAPWFSQSEITHDGSSAVQSGAISNSQNTSISTRVNSAGVLSFWWRVSSEANWDFLTFSVNGIEVAAISGEQDWTQFSYSIEDESGADLEWTYSKDTSQSGGSDAGWIDTFTFTDFNSGPPLFLEHPLGIAISGGSDYSLNSEVTGEGPFTYQWMKDGEDIFGATTASLDLSNIGASDSGSYQLVVSNNQGSATSSPAKIVLLENYSEALENSDLSFFSSTDELWFYQTDFHADGIDSLRSGAIENDSETEFSTTISGTGFINFNWAISSQLNSDFLEFYFDDILIDRISGSVDWTPLGFQNTLPGLHTLRWVYKKDSTGSSGLDAGFIDQIEYINITIPDAMDSEETQWSSDGVDTAIPVSDVTHDGVDSVKLGSIQHGEFTSISNFVYGSSTGFFWWKSSSQTGDSLRFYIDGVLKNSIDGDTAWQRVNFQTTGQSVHTLTWSYSKNNSGSANQDCGWIDEFHSTALTFPEAIDSKNVAWRQSGDAFWIPQTSTTYDSTDAARSGDIGDKEQSVFQTQLSGKGSVSFKWKVSSEKDYDRLSFYIDDQLIDSISGETDWQEKFVNVDTDGIHNLIWTYAKDESASSGNDAGYVDQVSINFITLGEALDNEETAWSSRGDETWFPQETVFSDTEDSAQTPQLADDQLTIVETTVYGEVGVDFQWKVSSEDGFDYLAFYVDYEPIEIISGESDWARQSFRITEPGTHVLSWAYVKDESISEGLDTAWIDQVNISPLDELPPSFADQAYPVQADLGSDVYLDASAIEELDTNYQWAFNDSDSPGATNSLLVISNVQQTHEGNYSAIATNNNGTSLYGPIELTTTNTLAPAVDNESHGWMTSGNSFWANQTDTTHDGTDSLQSGEIGNLERAYTQTVIIGASDIDFWWKVSSEDGFDFLEFNVDGTLITSISGEQDWSKFQHTIPTSGVHIVRWTYSKDGSAIEGEDAAWIDEVTIESLHESSYESWLEEIFNTEEIADLDISGENADPDQDGIINLVEYALLLDPLSPSSLPSIKSVNTAGKVYAQFEFTRRAQPTDIFYSIEISENLTDWLAGSDYTEKVTDNLDGTENVTSSILISESTRETTFLRLNISRF